MSKLEFDSNEYNFSPTAYQMHLQFFHLNHIWYHYLATIKKTDYCFGLSDSLQHNFLFEKHKLKKQAL